MDTYLAKSTLVPQVGAIMRSFWRLSSDGDWQFIRHSSTVERVCSMSNKVYAVKTRNSIYIVQVVA